MTLASNPIPYTASILIALWLGYRVGKEVMRDEIRTELMPSWEDVQAEIGAAGLQ
jgi:hypothetical protein